MKEKLIGKMALLPFTALKEFHAQKLCPGEPLSLFTQYLKRLLQSAMLGLDKDAGEQMLIHQFDGSADRNKSTAACNKGGEGAHKGGGMSPFVDDDRQSQFSTRCGYHRHSSG